MQFPYGRSLTGWRKEHKPLYYNTPGSDTRLTLGETEAPNGRRSPTLFFSLAGHTPGPPVLSTPLCSQEKDRQGRPCSVSGWVGSQRDLSSSSCPRPNVLAIPGSVQPRGGPQTYPSAPELMSSFHILFKMVSECVLTSL